jgi:MoxR-like ATPase
LKALEPKAQQNATRSPHHAVVLIDEIDKADPDVPNALLVPLGSGQFVVRETQALVQAVAASPVGRGSGALASPVLVVVTSNGERELPPAFVRRCVTHQLESPDAQRLELIAQAHTTRAGRQPDSAEQARIKDLAVQAVRIREELRLLHRKGAGTAEFLDAVRASRELGLSAADKDDWERLLSLTLRKDAARAG